MVRIDGNAARAARREANGTPIVYRLGGASVTLPAEVPISVLEIAERANKEKWSGRRFYVEYLRELLGGADWDAVAAERPSLEDLMHLFDESLRAYGASLGESSPSAASSRKRAGGSSRPRSRASTTSTRARSESAG